MLLAARDGVVRHFGDGENRWSVVHVDDLGELFRLAAERAPAGSVYNAAAAAVRVRDAAAAAAEAAGARVEPWPPEEAEEAWGGWVEAFSLDHVASRDRARRELGWSPTRPGLIEELRSAGPVRAGVA
jgi:nucleoside-diphosphate-sugar epimerase